MLLISVYNEFSFDRIINNFDILKLTISIYKFIDKMDTNLFFASYLRDTLDKMRSQLFIRQDVGTVIYKHQLQQ